MTLSHFTRATLAIAGISCRRVSVCLSPRLSQVGVLLKRLNVGSRKQHTIAQGQGLVFWWRKSRQNLNGVTPKGGAKCGWGRLNAAEVDENWRVSTQSADNLVWSQVYYTEHHLICLQHVRRDAARRAGLSATADPCFYRATQLC